MTELEQTPKKQEIYLPGLNGLRAIAALIVLFDHMFTGLSRFDIDEPAIFKFLFSDYSSRQAVNIFFVISGFLITYLLLIEKRTTGAISLRKFYIRRSLRIWPLYYLYLVAVVVVCVVMGYTTAYPTFIYYFLFAGNIVNSTTFLINHYWSLGVEEQFYIFWPALMKVIRGRWSVVILAVIILTLICFCQAYFELTDPVSVFFATSRFQCMMIGGVGAFVFLNKPKLYQFCYQRGVQAVCIIMLLLLLTATLRPAYFRDETASILILVLIIALISGKSYFLQLEGRLFRFLGKISFGIYVLHPLVMWMLLRVFKRFPVPGEYLICIVCIVTPALTILFAALSYNYVELKFLQLKKRFTVVNSTNTPAATT